MNISLRQVSIHPVLEGYVEKLWVFESDGRVPDPDMKVIVPNGMPKVIIPFRNGISGSRKEYSRLSTTNQITLIGVSDVPFIVDAQEDAPFGTIGIEFSPLGAHRFFRIRHSELRNHIFLADEVLGKTCSELEGIVADTTSVSRKIHLIQQYLLRLFSATAADGIFEFCVKRIRETNGLVTIKKLEQETGYSSRWLHMKFDEKIGVSPKSLCSIARFQMIYHTLINRPERIATDRSYYHIYYDQSHFIREFKRFTGMAPSIFLRRNNDFGKLFYKE